MPEAAQIIAARKIERTILNAQQFMQAPHHLSQNAAARALRVSPASLSRWSRAYAAGGLLALVPGRSTGRPKAVSLDDDEARKIRQLVLRTGSVPMAYQLHAETKDCSPEVRAVVESCRGGKRFPLSARRAAYVTPEEQALFRGPRTFDLLYYTQARNMEWVDEQGVHAPIRPGDFWEFDDMSVNKPYWYEWPYGGDPLSDKHGVRLGRQALLSRDVRGRWLGCDLIGRVRDAYRAEDVLRFLRRLFEDYGVPLGIRLERGVWASRLIDGVLVDGPSEDDIRAAWAGVQDLCRVQHVHSPKAKGIIEGGFHHLQKALAGMCGVGIGRRRGEMERATSELLACQAGRRHPKDCGFDHIDVTSRQIDTALRWLNEQTMDGRLLHGVADDLWRQREAEHGRLAPLPAELRYILCPAKGERAIKGGHIDVTLAHYRRGLFSFRVPVERFPYLGTGYRLRYAFDPAEPSAGCHLFNGESGVRNQHHFGRDEYLGLAPWAPERAQFDFSPAKGDGGGRKAAAAAARTAYRQSSRNGDDGRKVSQAIDGEGNVARAEIGGHAPQTDSAAAETLATPPASRRGSASADQTAGEAAHGGGQDLEQLRRKVEARRKSQLEALGVFNA